jgi:hypothetical protein
MFRISVLNHILQPVVITKAHTFWKERKKNWIQSFNDKMGGMGWDCVISVVTEVGDGWSGFECQHGH